MNLRQDPLGVPLREIADLFSEGSFRCQLIGNELTMSRDGRTTKITVVRPEEVGDPSQPLQAGVRVVTDVQDEIGSIIQDRAKLIATFNRYAALGALFLDQGKLCVGSRLTIYRGEDAWDGLHMPLLVFAATHAADAIVFGIQQVLSREPGQQGKSSWTRHDFAQVHAAMSQVCVCSAGAEGFTAEFPLEPGQTSAALGSKRTALLQLRADQPHPGFGGGLLSLLQLPNKFPSQDKVPLICEQLNRLEMAARDLPPHFGAWCPSQGGQGVAYVSCLPNLMYGVTGIALNVAIWAMHRAEWAAEQLKRLRV